MAISLGRREYGGNAKIDVPQTLPENCHTVNRSLIQFPIKQLFPTQIYCLIALGLAAERRWWWRRSTPLTDTHEKQLKLK